MKIIGTNPDGSLEYEFPYGTIAQALKQAREIAIEQDTMVYFDFNSRRICVGPQSNVDHLWLVYTELSHTDGTVIGPHIDKNDVPEPTHGIIEVTLRVS